MKVGTRDSKRYKFRVQDSRIGISGSGLGDMRFGFPCVLLCPTCLTTLPIPTNLLGYSTFIVFVNFLLFDFSSLTSILYS